MTRTITKLTPLSIREADSKPKLVAAYARVSLGNDAMLQSLSAQISYYSAKIQKTPGWVYAGVYADEAKSGTRENRKEFQRLLQDCRDGKIDMVITKSVSRFARNTLTTLQVIRELQALNVDVYFEEQNIHTLGGDGEFLLTLLAVYAQEEARSVSENMKWRIKDRYQQGHLWSVNMYGYAQKGTTLEVIPEEAAVIRMVVDLYLEGAGGERIARTLNEAGHRTKLGNLWRATAVRMLIRNEKLVGDTLLQKTFRPDYLTKVSVINHGERPQFYVKHNHEPILDRETYERLLLEAERRTKKYGPVTDSPGLYPFSGLLICGKCGAKFRRKIICNGTKYEKNVWICTTYNNLGKAHCPSKQIPDDILLDVSALALGLPEFNAEVFFRQIEKIRVPDNGTLIFVFRDGSTVEKTWENPSRRNSWDAEARQKVSEWSTKYHAEKRAKADE